MQTNLKKNVLFLLGVALCLALVPWLSSCGSVPAPEVTRAEFPFEIVYEKDGERITVADVYVCEFDGYGWNENAGRHRQWKGAVKSTGASYVLLVEEGNLKLVCGVGSPAYYMGDPSMAGAAPFTPYIYYIRTQESGGVSSGTAGIEPLLEEYKLSLVSWEFASPIENSFE